MRRRVGGAGTAAPAPVPRKHGPGRPRVTVRPHYGGPPFSGLDAGRMNAGESLRDQGGRNAPRPAPEATVPRPKIAAVERREARHPISGMSTLRRRASPASSAQRD